jgi:ligand-binding sensor domain-containing protein
MYLKTIKASVSFLFVYSVLSIGSAQPLVLDTAWIPFERMGVRSGLSNGLITGLVQDRKGYLWIGTKKGLNRYDGYHIKEYQHIPGDSLSIPMEIEGWCIPILVDSKNTLWVGGPDTKTGDGDATIYVMDPRNEAFIPIRIPEDMSLVFFDDAHENFWFFKEREGWYLLSMDRLPRDLHHMNTQTSLSS